MNMVPMATITRSVEDRPPNKDNFVTKPGKGGTEEADKSIKHCIQSIRPTPKHAIVKLETTM